MHTYICVTCGTQYPAAPNPPSNCPICDDERQYVGHLGQEWIPFERLQQKFRNVFFQEGSGMWGISTEPTAPAMVIAMPP